MIVRKRLAMGLSEFFGSQINSAHHCGDKTPICGFLLSVPGETWNLPWNLTSPSSSNKLRESNLQIQFAILQFQASKLNLDNCTPWYSQRGSIHYSTLRLEWQLEAFKISLAWSSQLSVWADRLAGKSDLDLPFLHRRASCDKVSRAHALAPLTVGQSLLGSLL